MNSLTQLTDDSLHSELKRLVGSSNTLTAQLLAQLGELEARGIHRERACSSLAGPVRHLEAGVAAGQAPPRTSDDESADAPPSHAASGVPSGPESGMRTPTIDEEPDGGTRPPSGESEHTASAPATAELRYKVQFTADQAYVDLLEEARNLLQHELPARDLVEVQRRALELLVRKLRQRKYAARERPRRKAPEPAHEAPQMEPEQPRARPSARKSELSRYIPAAVRRRVWQRDEGRCTYRDARSERCREQSGLEFHHQHPHARRGPASVENITLRCRSHNDLAAEQDFGRDLIREKRRAAREEPGRASAAP